jgi:hypothetical protein
MLNKQLSDDSFMLRIQVMTKDITIYFMRSITLIVIIMNLYCSFGRTYNIEEVHYYMRVMRDSVFCVTFEGIIE